eukprot:5756393-Amphidinium_carterae.1
MGESSTVQQRITVLRCAPQPFSRNGVKRLADIKPQNSIRPLESLLSPHPKTSPQDAHLCALARHCMLCRGKDSGDLTESISHHSTCEGLRQEILLNNPPVSIWVSLRPLPFVDGR